MKLAQVLSIALVFFFAQVKAQNGHDTPVAEEQLYNKILQSLSGKAKSEYILKLLKNFSACDNKVEVCLNAEEILILALDEASHFESQDIRIKMQATIQTLRKSISNLGVSLQLYVIYRQVGGPEETIWNSELKARARVHLKTAIADKKTVYVLNTYEEYFSDNEWQRMRQWIQERYGSELLLSHEGTSLPTVKVLQDLIYVEPDIEKYKSGAYTNRPRIYMFCRVDRSHPCLIIIKDKFGGLVREANGRIWSQPSLGYSRHRKPYNVPNGNTPSGIFRVDGVMPSADQNWVFGDYRRLILNFVAASTDESVQKWLLPPSSHTEQWWKEGVVARDVGRGLLRIHGTRLSSMKSSNYYPLVPTSGCIAQRENRHDGVNYKDQRRLLDGLMMASEFSPTYENELNIRALLYVINIDNQEKAVHLQDLIDLGVLRDE